MITVFWYLTDVEEGGETIFPKHGQPVCPNYQRLCEGAHEPDMKSCDAPLKVRPTRGTVILWYNMHPSGRGDRNAIHAGCPPGVKDTKWSANKWVNTKPFNEPPANWDPGHPAIDRYGWEKFDPNACGIEFWNEFAEPIEVHWIAHDGSSRKIAGLESGTRTTQNSFYGHRFFVQAKGRKSQPVTCTKGSTNRYLVGGDLVIRDSGSTETLLTSSDL